MVRFDDSKRLPKRHTGMEPPPFARVPHPVDIEMVPSHPVDTSEGHIELLAAIVLISHACGNTLAPQHFSSITAILQ